MASIGEIESEQEKNIRSAFEQARVGRRARADVARQQTMEELQKGAAQIQGGFGGSALKLREKAIRALQDQEAGGEAEATAQEAQTLGALGTQKAQMAFNLQELDENKKTNFINAFTALKNAGLLKGDSAAWSANMFRNPYLRGIYEESFKTGGAQAAQPGQIPGSRPGEQGYGSLSSPIYPVKKPFGYR